MTRTISRGLAGIVEELELAQPQVVTLGELARIAQSQHLATAPKVLAARLRARGWLVPTGTRGVWEFAPGAHAGPYGHGNPATPLRAALEKNPALPACLALGTAAWAHGLADRVPSRIDVAVAARYRTPAALAREARVTSFTSQLDPLLLKTVPAHRVETILVHLATRPTDVRSWSSVAEWLPEVAAEADAALVAIELASRPATVAVRTGYLLDGLRPDISHRLIDRVGSRVWFGPRAKPRRNSERWQVTDTVLPFDPSSLSPGLSGAQ